MDSIRSFPAGHGSARVRAPKSQIDYGERVGGNLLKSEFPYCLRAQHLLLLEAERCGKHSHHHLCIQQGAPRAVLVR